MPSSLVDTGATINLLSVDKVKKHSLPTHPTPPIRIHEPMNPQGVLVNQKVISKVHVHEDDRESSDIILGMPFLASEKILIDVAHGKVILPANEGGEKDEVTEDENAEDFEDFFWNHPPAVVRKWLCRE
jgi:hypothetical protein